jgi:chorismate mutase/prephenate dehydratase
MKIGFQGLVGCNSYRIINKYFTGHLDLKNYKSFEDLFIALENNEIDCFVLPVRNNTTGEIKENLDLVNKYNFRIEKELSIEINHCLYGLKESKLDSIRKIISHREALKQCSKFISNYETEEIWNTVGGIDIIINKNDISIGCIAPNDINYSNIKVLLENISDNKNNKTYFYLITKCLHDIFNKSQIPLQTYH